MLNQIPTWVWALLPAVVLAVILLRQRIGAGVFQPTSIDAAPSRRASRSTLEDLQEEMLRGLLRKEGLLPPAPPPRPVNEPAVFACPQQFKIVPVEASK